MAWASMGGIDPRMGGMDASTGGIDLGMGGSVRVHLKMLHPVLPELGMKWIHSQSARSDTRCVDTTMDDVMG